MNLVALDADYTSAPAAKGMKKGVVVRGVITNSAFLGACTLKKGILSVQIAKCGFLLTWADKAQAAAARAFGDYRLLFHFKILIDVFAFNAQLATAMAIRAGCADESACFFAVCNAHGMLLFVSL